MNTTSRLPVFALSHGGGPWPWLKDSTVGDWSSLERSLIDVPSQIGTVPRAIVCVTAHWIGREFTVQTNLRPPMLYDYGGFPDFTYGISYPAPGSAEVSARVAELIEGDGFSVRRDPTRGFDHGTFVPLAVAFPEASIPVVQLSIREDFDAAAHLAMGRALAPLRDEGVLIVGSGVFAFHNFQMMGPGGLAPSTAFDVWIRETVSSSVGPERSRRLVAWEQAPSARICHPEPDHFLPLLVAAGAAEDEVGHLHYHEDAMMGFSASSSFRFGEPASRPSRVAASVDPAPRLPGRASDGG